MANEFRVKNGLIVSGNATVTGIVLDGNTITGVDDSGEFTDNDAHIMTSAGINDKFGVIAGSTSITTLGTITTGTWNATVIASAYLDADTAHLSGAQTFTGTKTLNSFKGTAGATVTNILDEDAMGSNSATALATQQSIKAYVDDSVGSAGGGDITAVVAGVGLSGGATSGSATLTLDMSELTDMTADVTPGADEFILLDGGADRRKLMSEIDVGGFRDIITGPFGWETDQENVALGEGALDSLTQYVNGLVTDGGSSNTAIGESAGTAVSTGDGNVLVGHDSGKAITSGVRNIMIGSTAGDGFDGESDNIGIGFSALGGSVAGGEFNVGIGTNSLIAVTSGDSNTAVGHDSAETLQGGSNNVVIGADAEPSAIGAINQIVIGQGAVGLADNAVVLGNTSITAWLPPDDAGVDLGSSSYQFKDAYIHGTLEADAITIGGTNVVSGSLITTLGTISAGVWEGTVVAAAYLPDASVTAQGVVELATSAETVIGTDAARVVTPDGLADWTGGNSAVTKVGTIATGVWNGTAIAGGYIANDAIDSQHYADGSIDNAHIADDAIDSEHYAAASIDFAHIQNVAANSILGRNANSAGVLSEVALTTTQILIGDGTGFTAAALSGDATMTNAGVVSLAANSVDSDQYVDGSIDNAHLADDAVNSDELAAGAVDDAHLSDGVATGLAGTGTTATSGVLNVIGGTGITANANDIAIDSTVTTLAGSQTLTNKTLTAPIINGWQATIVTISGAALTTAQSGSYVIWTGGTCTLPASCVAGTQYTIFNNTGSSATVALGSGNSVLSGWAANAAVADHDATSYVAISATNWVQVGA